jgi:hypothetical protein
MKISTERSTISTAPASLLGVVVLVGLATALTAVRASAADPPIKAAKNQEELLTPPLSVTPAHRKTANWKALGTS